MRSQWDLTQKIPIKYVYWFTGWWPYIICVAVGDYVTVIFMFFSRKLKWHD